MDKENKYYSLIEGLVKKHRKFPGYEAIIEEIIDDVFAHSEVIINSIDNESVIESYLEKVISTSIITVPKKMNFNTSAHHRVITIVPQQNVSMASVISNEEITVNKPVTAEPESEVNDSIDIAVPNEVQPVYESEDKQLVHETPLTEPVLNTEADESENSVETAEDIMSFTQNIGGDKADPELVDKMINSLGNDELEVLIDTQDESSLSDETVELTDLADVDELEVINIAPQDEAEEEITEASDELIPSETETSETEFDSDSYSEDLSLNMQLPEAEALLPEENEHTDEISSESDDVIHEASEDEFTEDIDEGGLEISFDDETVQELNDEVLEGLSEDETELSENMPAEEMTLEPNASDEQETEDNNDVSDLVVVNDEQQLFLEPEADIGESELSPDAEEPSSELTIDIQPVLSMSEEQDVNVLPLETEQDSESDILPVDNTLEILPAHDDIQDNVSADMLSDNIEEDENFGGLIDSEADILSGDNELVEFSADSKIAGTDMEEVVPDTDSMEPADDGGDVFGLELQEYGTADIDGDGLEINIASDDEIGIMPEDNESEDFQISFENEENGSEKTIEFSDEYSDNISLTPSMNPETKNESEYKPADYSVFDFSPENFKPSLNLDLVTDKLLQLNQKRPELSVLTIFDMKYKQDMTIDEIAAELNISNNQVIMALNKIVEVV